MDDVARAAADYLKSSRPHLVFVHFADPDSLGHINGWMSPPYLRTLQRIPSAILTLVRGLREAGIEEQTLLIITADHGGKGRDHATRDREDMTIPWIASGPGVRKNYELSRRLVIYDTAPTVLQALGLAVPSGLDGQPVADIFARVPARPVASR
jgi:phosphopentomutase